MSLTERVTTRDKRNSLFVIHCHATEGLTNVFRCCQWIGIPVRAFGIDVTPIPFLLLRCGLILVTVDGFYLLSSSS
jgi:hypothetical protein